MSDLFNAGGAYDTCARAEELCNNPNVSRAFLNRGAGLEFGRPLTTDEIALITETANEIAPSNVVVSPSIASLLLIFLWELIATDPKLSIPPNHELFLTPRAKRKLRQFASSDYQECIEVLPCIIQALVELDILLTNPLYPDLLYAPKIIDAANEVLAQRAAQIMVNKKSKQAHAPPNFTGALPTDTTEELLDAEEIIKTIDDPIIALQLLENITPAILNPPEANTPFFTPEPPPDVSVLALNQILRFMTWYMFADPQKTAGKRVYSPKQILFRLKNKYTQMYKTDRAWLDDWLFIGKGVFNPRTDFNAILDKDMCTQKQGQVWQQLAVKLQLDCGILYYNRLCKAVAASQDSNIAIPTIVDLQFAAKGINITLEQSQAAQIVGDEKKRIRDILEKTFGNNIQLFTNT